MIEDNEDVMQDEPHPLDQFVGIFKSGPGQAMAEEAATRINDYMLRRQIAEDNTRASQAFYSNLNEMRSNFTGMVEEDPHATHLALDLAHLGVGAMIGTVPDVDPEHMLNISMGMQRDIARNAVRHVAERDEGMARSFLDDSRIGGLLGDERPALDGYISSQSIARRLDGEAAQKANLKDSIRGAHQAAWDYVAGMVDPDTGEVHDAPGWASQVMADQRMPPDVKAKIFDVYGRLTENGDVGTSDPGAIRDLIRSVAGGAVSPVDILGRAGDDLRAADAVYLAKLASNPREKRRAEELAATLEAAERQIAAPENGVAGRVAFERFANWMVPAARDGADFNPNSQDYILQGNRMQHFAPRASDVADHIVARPESRRPLEHIFGRG